MPEVSCAKVLDMAILAVGGSIVVAVTIFLNSPVWLEEDMVSFMNCEEYRWCSRLDHAPQGCTNLISFHRSYTPGRAARGGLARSKRYAKIDYLVIELQY